MQPVLPDSSVCIAALRAGDEAVSGLKWLPPHARVWFSAVVLEELYAGASGRDRHWVEWLEREFGRVGRILVPSLSDWTQTGRVLAQVAAAYGYEMIGRGRLTNDALIAVSAARQGITVVTANERDFNRLARFWSFQYEVRKI